MSEELGVLNMLARRQKEAKESRTDGVPAHLYIEAERRADNAEQTVRLITAQAARDRDAFEAERASLREATAKWEERFIAEQNRRAEAEARAANIPTPSAAILTSGVDQEKYDAKCAECSDLQVRLASVSATHAECSRRDAMQKEQVQMLSSRVQVLEKVDKPNPVDIPRANLDGYDIDVVRGGDDRIRSLKIRYT